MFLENGVFAPYQKQVVLTKNGENDALHSAHKNKGLWSSEPETDENDENGGCPSDKTTVCQKHRFRHPDKLYVKTLFSEQLSELVGCQNFSPDSRSLFFNSWGGPRTPDLSLGAEN